MGVKGKHYYLFYYTITVMVVLSVFPVINVSVNQWGIFTDDYYQMRKGIEPNKNYLKTKYIIDNPNLYDTYIFGSSKVGSVGVSSKNDRLFNFTYSMGVPHEYLSTIKILLDNNVSIKKVYIGLDEFSYDINSKVHDSDYMRKPYPRNIFEKLEFFKHYLFKLPSDRDWDILLKNQYPLAKADSIIGNDKALRVSAAERIKKAENNNVRMLNRESKYIFGDRIDETIKDIEELILLSHEAGFELRAFYSPMHYKTLMKIDLEQLKFFKQKLASVISFWDFGGFNQYCYDNRFWHDHVHYSSEVGDLIFGIIASQIGQEEKTEKFGVYVTKDNVDMKFQKIMNPSDVLDSILEIELNWEAELFERFTNEESILLPTTFSAFDGKSFISQSLKQTNQLYRYELLLRSTEKDNVNFSFSNTGPPMPFVCSPLFMYQVSNDEFHISVHADENVTFKVRNTHDWIHVVFSVDEMRVGHLEINGVEVGEVEECEPSAKNIMIGKGFQNRYWNGEIGYVAIYQELQRTPKLIYLFGELP